MAHEVGRKFGGELAAVGVAPQQLGSLSVGSDADDAQVGLGIGVHVLEVFAGAGDNENLANNSFVELSVKVLGSRSPQTIS